MNYKINQIYKQDQGGTSYALSMIDYIKSMKVNLFTYEGWPFQDQTPEDLEIELYDHGAVQYYSIADEKFFVPVTLSKRVNGLNTHLVTSVVTGDYNRYITDAVKLNDEAVKATKPWFFDNEVQKAPRVLQNTLIKELAGAMNANKSNRINKNKQAIVEVEDGQALITAHILNITTDDYSPFTIVEKSKKDGNPLTSDAVKPMTGGVADLYNSLSTEKKDIEKQLMILNGIRASQSGEKTSAQETDQQTSDKDRDTGNILWAMLKTRQKWVKNARKNLNAPNFKVKFSSTVQSFIDSLEQSQLEEGVKDTQDQDTQEQQTFLQKIKALFTKEEKAPEEVADEN